MVKKMAKICVWGAWYESNNAGDQAILMTMGKLLGDKISNLELVVFSNRPKFTEDYMRPIIPIRAISHRYNTISVVRELLTTDVFLVGGGTPFYDDWFHLLVMLVFVMTARLGGNPVITYAISVRPIESFVGKTLSKIIFTMVNRITIREPNAKELINTLGIDKNIVLYTDPAVTLKPSSDEDVLTILKSEGIEMDKRPLFAVCPHFFSPNHSYHVHHYERFSKKSIDQYHHVLSEAIRWLNRLGPVILLPFNTEYPDDDCDTFDEIRQRLGSEGQIYYVSRQYGPSSLAGILKKCELAITVRLHAAVLATSVGTPVVAISYGPKVNGYMRRIGLERYSHDYQSLEINALL